MEPHLKVLADFEMSALNEASLKKWLRFGNHYTMVLDTSFIPR